MASSSSDSPPIAVGQPIPVGPVAKSQPIPGGVREVTLTRAHGYVKLGINIDGAVVSQVFSNTPAFGKVFVGDKILTVNSMAFAPHRGMLETAGEAVRLLVCNGPGGVTVGQSAAAGAPHATTGSPLQTRTLVLERKGPRLGFNLEDDGVAVKYVFPGTKSVARGNLYIGDRILSIDGSRTTCMRESDALLKAAGATVTLEVVSEICSVHTTTQPSERRDTTEDGREQSARTPDL